MKPRTRRYLTGSAILGSLVFGYVLGQPNEPPQDSTRVVYKTKKEYVTKVKEVPGELPDSCREAVRRLPALMTASESFSNEAGAFMLLLSNLGRETFGGTVPEINEITLQLNAVKTRLDISANDTGEARQIMSIYLEKCLREMPS